MPASLDLTLLPLIRTAGQDQPDMAGILIAEPPRRAARSRSADHLILYLALVGNAPLSPGKQEDVLAQLARTYFDTPGSVTAALRAAAESLNAFLLDRNLHSSNTGRQSIGWLTVVALRQNQLYLAQSGPVHAFLMTVEGVQHLYDPQVAGRGLGLSRTTSVRFFHSLLAPDDTLLLAAQPAPSWTAAGLTGTHGQGPESLRRRLFNRSVPDIHAVLIQAKAGRGRIFQYQPPAPGPAVDSTPPAPETQPAPRPVLSSIPPIPSVAQPLPEPAGPSGPPVPPGAAVFEVSLADPAGEPAQASGSSQPAETAPVASAPPSASQPAPQSSPEPATGSAVQPAADPLPPAPTIESSVDSSGNGQPLDVYPVEASPMPQTAPAGIAPIEFPAKAAPAVLAASAASGATDPFTAEAMPAAAPAAPPTPAPARPPRPRRSFSLAPLVGLLAALVRPFATAGRGLGRGLRSLLLRMLPGEGWVALSSQTLAFIAIAVPITVVAVATWVYRYKGVTAQAQTLYQQAVVAATAAEAETDPLTRRIALGETLTALDRVDAWYPLPESQSLRASIQKSLDTLDLVKRVDFKPAVIGGLDAAVQVTRLVSADSDLYMLDGRSGRVLRAFLTSGGYERDDSFQCGPPPSGQRAEEPAAEGVPEAPAAPAAPAAPIIDIAAWPPENTPEATLIALDKTGFVWYCAPGQAPQSELLALPPSLIWEDLVGFSLYLSHFQLLDPKQNAVWIFWNSNFETPPELFFGEDVPPMQDVIDMAVNNDELYLLHADGRLTLCYYSAMTVAPTRCTDPTPYIDLRPGRENTPMTPPSPFSQILFNPPPDPSLYFLEPENQAINHFSLRNLAFQHQYVPVEPLPGGPATAFAVSTLDRTFFMASGSGVYYARIP